MPPLRARTPAPRVPTRKPRHAPKRGAVPSAGRPATRSTSKPNVLMAHLTAPLGASTSAMMRRWRQIQTASRSCLAQAQRKPTPRILPDAWGGRGDASEAGQRFWGGEAGTAIADLGLQACRRTRPPRGSEVKRCAAVCRLSCLMVCSDRVRICSTRGAGGVCLGGAVRAAGASRCGRPAGVQHLGIDPAAVADRGHLGAQAFGSEQVRAVLALEASGTAGCTRAHAYWEESVRDAYGGQHGDV